MPNPNPQTMLNALQDLKSEIKNLRTELSRLEGSILKERLKAIEEVLTQNRLLLYVDQIEEDLDEDLDKLLNHECKNHLQCLKTFKTMTSESLKLIKNANPTEAITDLESTIEKIGNTIQKTKDSSCEVCHQNFQKKLRREKRALQTIVLVEKPGDNKQNQEELNISQLVETMLEPLANAARLKILLSLCEGKKSFSKIAQLTNLRGGHLIFHLNKLSAAGLIAQEDNKGDYVITQRGIEAAKKVSLLQIK